MDILREKQLTVRATKRPVEYNYTNADIHHQDTTAADGYQVEYPLKWCSDQSINKVIGIRRINYKPTSINLACDLIISPGVDEVTIPLIYTFTEQNTFEEIINKIAVDVNEVLDQSNHTYYRFHAEYNKDLGTLTFRVAKELVNQYIRISFPYGAETTYNPQIHAWDGELTHYHRQFLMMFNQQLNKENVDKVHNYYYANTQSITFQNVWNRDSFYCHASFSDSPKQIIGINHDFWQTPSVFYAPGDNSNNFNIYFTTDTVHRILPRNGVMLIQMSYIYNFTNSMLTYV